MELINQTPFEIVWIPGRLQHPAHSLTFIVKGTFVLVKGGHASIAEQQDPSSPDVPYPEPEEASLYYESDFAHFKPRADLLLSGRCYAPGGRPVKEAPVGFSVGASSRRLRVIGDRTWNRGLGGASASEPKPFITMDVRYERAFGGPRFAPNRAGRGYHRDKPESDVELLMPNIEDPGNPVRSPSDAVAPAGFGPLSRTWAPRRNMIGTYGKPWFRSRSPWFPQDMDWAVNNAAPVPSQLQGYLKGDEPFVLENLRADAPRFAGALPGLRVRCFVDRLRGGTTGSEELAMHLDTLWIDAEIGKLVLVWRGSCPAASEEFEDLRRLRVVSEALDAAGGASRAGTASAPAVSSSALVPAPASQEEPAAAPSALAEDPATTGGSDGDGDPEAAASNAGADAEDDADAGDADEYKTPEERKRALIEMLRGQEKMLDSLPDIREVQEAKESTREAILLLTQLGAPVPEPDVEPWDRERVIAAIGAKTPLAGADLADLDLSAIAFGAASLERARLDRCNLQGADLSGCDLSDASLIAVSAEAADLEGAILQRCLLSKARLQNACLNGCDLRGADLAGADLRGAQLTGARAADASFREADLTGVQAEEIDLAGANLELAKGTGARLAKARFDGASLSGASLRESWFTGASFQKARALAIDLTSCDVTGADFAGADLGKSTFHAVRGDRSAWTGAVLDGARFTEADLDEADFSKASLVSADFQAASLRSANFRRAILERARFVQSNLFEALLPSARLTEADLRGANLFAADLADVEARGVQLQGANVKRTQWDRQ